MPPNQTGPPPKLNCGTTAPIPSHRVPLWNLVENDDATCHYRWNAHTDCRPLPEGKVTQRNKRSRPCQSINPHATQGGGDSQTPGAGRADKRLAHTQCACAQSSPDRGYPAGADKLVLPEPRPVAVRRTRTFAPAVRSYQSARELARVAAPESGQLRERPTTSATMAEEHLFAAVDIERRTCLAM